MTAVQHDDEPHSWVQPEPDDGIGGLDHGLRYCRLPVGASASDFSYALPVDEARGIVRVAVIRRWDLPALMNAAQLCPPADSRLQISRDNASLGMQHLWRVTEDDLMGLANVGVPRGALRLLTFAAGSAPNLVTALRRYDEFRKAFAGLPAVTIEEFAGTATLTIDHTGFDPCSVTVVSLGLLVVVHRFLSWATRRPPVLHTVALPHPRPEHYLGYQIMFGVVPVFNAAKPTMVFNADALTRPFVRSHEEIERFLDDAPAHLLAECTFHTSVSNQVRCIIEDRLGQPCSTSDIAAAVGMSRPTLWRRLREENNSISRIRDQVLRDAALSGLARGEETIAQLSQRLGFSEPSAFTRAFRRWTGHPPSTYQPR